MTFFNFDKPLDGAVDESEKPLPTGVGGLLFRPGGEACFISRKSRVHQPGEPVTPEPHKDFGLPGGKVDPGESEREALRRELREELGIEIRRFHRLFGAPDEGGYWFLTFLVTEWHGEPHDAEQKGAVVTWLQPRRLVEMPGSYVGYNRALFRFLGLLR
jgi:8-oxo-dGTP pyrophosphatase MutT (NUDIX family)